MASDSAELRFAGIDTHKDIHVGAVINGLGRLIATAEFVTTAKGYCELHGWLVKNGPVQVVGIEGTGSYGAGIAALLSQHSVAVVEVNRPDRQLRRRHGKTDTIDAEAAARSVLNGLATGAAKSHDGIVESIRLHRLTLTTLRKSRTAAINTLRSVLITTPAALRDELEPLPASKLFARCARLRVDTAPSADPEQAAKQALRTLARQIAALDAELDKLRSALTMLAETANPGSCPPVASASIAHQRYLSPPVTIPNGCAASRPSLPFAAPHRLRRPLDERFDIDSTAVATAKPTAHSGASR